MEFKKRLLPAAITAALCAGIYAPISVALTIPGGGYVVESDEIVTSVGLEDALSTDGAVTGDIVNNGSIIGAENDGIAIDHTFTGDIINKGTIEGDGDGIDIGSALTGTIVNEQGGIIRGDSGIEIEGSMPDPDPDPSSDEDFNAIVNAGLIEATGEYDGDEGDGDAIIIKGTISEEIVNQQGGIIRSQNGNGIRIGTESESDSIPSTVGRMNDDIINDGRIEAALAGIYVDNGRLDGFIENGSTGEIVGGETGIDVSGEGLQSIVNSGLIEGQEHGIYVDGSESDNNTIEYAIENHGIIRAYDEEGAAIYSEDVIGYGDISGDDPESDVKGLINYEGGLIENIKGSAIHLKDDAEIMGDFRNEGTIRGAFAIEDSTDSDHTLVNTGLIDGLIIGSIDDNENITASSLSLDNEGTFRTEQGSSFKSYVGGGEIIAVLSDATTSEPVINITGSATFEAGSKVLVEGKKDDFTATIEGNEYVILEAGALSIADEILNVDSNSALLEVTLVGTDSNQITVVVKANNAGEVIGQVGATEEEKEFIDSFQNEVIANIDDENDVIYQMFLEAQSNPEALKQLAEDLQPEVSGSDAAAATATQSATFGSVATRTSSIRSGTNSGDLFQTGGVWGQLLHSKGKQDDKGESNGFTSHLTGITIGADSELNTNWTLGAAFTTAKGTTNVKDSSNSTESDSVIGTLYASWQSDAWFADIMASAGRTSNEGERLNGLITSDYDADQLGLRLTVGKDIQLPMADALLQPTVGFNYGRIEIDSYQEEGSAAALEMQTQSYETLELGAGVEAIKSFEMDKGVLTTSVSLNGWHDFAADQVKTKSRFLVGDTILTTTGESPEKTTWQAGFGVDYLADNNMTFSVSYDHTWKKSFKADSVSAKIRYDF